MTRQQLLVTLVLEPCMWVIDIRHWLNEQQDGPAAAVAVESEKADGDYNLDNLM